LQPDVIEKASRAFVFLGHQVGIEIVGESEIERQVGPDAPVVLNEGAELIDPR
jgi:hypothetical protein